MSRCTQVAARFHFPDVKARMTYAAAAALARTTSHTPASRKSAPISFILYRHSARLDSFPLPTEYIIYIYIFSRRVMTKKCALRSSCSWARLALSRVPFVECGENRLTPFMPLARVVEMNIEDEAPRRTIISPRASGKITCEFNLYRGSRLKLIIC